MRHRMTRTDYMALGHTGVGYDYSRRRGWSCGNASRFMDMSFLTSGLRDIAESRRRRSVGRPLDVDHPVNEANVSSK